jgi:hypothetical protein
MNRWTTSTSRLYLAACLWALASWSAAFAQTEAIGRQFPAQALRGKLVITQFPEVLLDGQAARMAPGVRIRSPQNLLLSPAAITGETLTVNLVRDGQGLIRDVWVLTPEEASQRLKTATPERNFSFASDAEAPKQDDGKTPYRDLPGYKRTQP